MALNRLSSRKHNVISISKAIVQNCSKLPFVNSISSTLHFLSTIKNNVEILRRGQKYTSIPIAFFNSSNQHVAHKIKLLCFNAWLTSWPETKTSS